MQNNVCSSCLESIIFNQDIYYETKEFFYINKEGKIEFKFCRKQEIEYDAIMTPIGYMHVPRPTTSYIKNTTIQILLNMLVKEVNIENSYGLFIGSEYYADKLNIHIKYLDKDYDFKKENIKDLIFHNGFLFFKYKKEKIVKRANKNKLVKECNKSFGFMPPNQKRNYKYGYNQRAR